MKKGLIYITAIFLVTFCFSFAGVQAQEAVKEKEKQEQDKQKQDKEYQLQQLIEEQKKELIDQQKKAEQLQQALEQRQRDVQQRNRDAYGEFYRRSGTTFIGRDDSDQPYVVAPRLDFSTGAFVGRPLGDGERTTWDFSKNVKESSFSRQYSFDVEKTASNVIMSITGDCKAGEIRVKILMPGGKTYSDILIDQYGNLNWRKSFTISEEENKDKRGEWVFKIDAAKATGYFKISLQTY